MDYVTIYDALSYVGRPRPPLNMRQLLNPIFFERTVAHTDTKKQRKARIRTRAYAQARALKAMPVPLRDVAPPDPLTRYDCVSDSYVSYVPVWNRRRSARALEVGTAWHRAMEQADVISPTGRVMSFKGPELQNIPTPNFDPELRRWCKSMVFGRPLL